MSKMLTYTYMYTWAVEIKIRLGNVRLTRVTYTFKQNTRMM